jgi:hypothetical protein
MSWTSSEPTDATVGSDTYTLMATSDSGLAVALTIDDTSSAGCSITDDGVVSFLNAGTCTINTNHSAATELQRSFWVSPALSLALANANPEFGVAANFTAAASGFESGDTMVTFWVDDVGNDHYVAGCDASA